LDRESILNAARETRIILTVEEHDLNGGLGSAVAEVLTGANSRNVILKRLGIENWSGKIAGTHDYLCKVNGLDTDSIVKTVLQLLHEYPQKPS
jgi:transketolase